MLTNLLSHRVQRVENVLKYYASTNGHAILGCIDADFSEEAKVDPDAPFHGARSVGIPAAAANGQEGDVLTSRVLNLQEDHQGRILTSDDLTTHKLLDIIIVCGFCVHKVRRHFKDIPSLGDDDIRTVDIVGKNYLGWRR